MDSNNSTNETLKQAAIRTTVIWGLLSLPSFVIVAWLGKMRPEMPLWQWGLGIYACVQLSVAMFVVRRQWLRAQAASQ